MLWHAKLLPACGCETGRVAGSTTDAGESFAKKFGNAFCASGSKAFGEASNFSLLTSDFSLPVEWNASKVCRTA